MNKTSFNRETNTPLYLQLKNLILQRIDNGEWAEGSHIPTELEMKEEYGLSRATIRQALEELENDGFIERKRRLGTVISRQRVRPELIKLTSFTDDILSRGLEPQSSTLNTEFVSPPSRVRIAFGLDEYEKVWRVLRLRSASGEPYGLHELYLPPSLQFSPRELTNLASYYALLAERHNLKPGYATEQLTASLATKTEAALLSIPIGSPVLVAWRITYSQEHQPIEVVKILYRADRYEYTIQLIA